MYIYTVPLAPQNVTAPENLITATSVYINWLAPSPVRGVILSYSLEYTSNVDNDSVVNITGMSFNLTGLMEAVVYTIRVYGHTDKGRGEGATVMVTTAEHCKSLYLCVVFVLAIVYLYSTQCRVS